MTAVDTCWQWQLFNTNYKPTLEPTWTSSMLLNNCVEPTWTSSMWLNSCVEPTWTSSMRLNSCVRLLTCVHGTREVCLSRSISQSSPLTLVCGMTALCRLFACFNTHACYYQPILHQRVKHHRSNIQWLPCKPSRTTDNSYTILAASTWTQVAGCP